jgi:N-acetylglucosaminyldiphosphoundecaprenol N-acetyl-beta-D-mannosaminyltransferase
MHDPIVRHNILGIEVSAINMPLAVQCIDDWVETKTGNYVCVTNVHAVMESQRDEALRRIYNRAGLVTPDGMPLVWLLKSGGFTFVSRVYGPDLMLAVFDRGQRRGYRHFLYGTTPATLEKVSGKLKERFPASVIVGIYAPPFRALTPAEDQEIVDRINASDADIVWVGLGLPKQERWMAAHVVAFPAKVMIGVGAAFDFHAGNVRQAPRWVQDIGMEWFFRLCMEPRRLWKRYFRNNPLFIAYLIAQKMGFKSYTI